MEGAIAAVLLLGGGLKALQTASITAGLPFTIVLLIMIYSLYKGFNEELFHLDTELSQGASQESSTAMERLDGPQAAPGSAD